MAGSLAGRVCLVTGASRGIGRGIALQLGAAGATVYVTGRKPSQSDAAKSDKELPTLDKTAQEITARSGKGIAVYCDHADEKDIKALFDKIAADNNGQLDILVNNAYAAVNTIFSNTGKKFWEMDVSVWDDVNNVGLRNHYFCTVYAARLMVPRRQGLIVTVSSAGGMRYLFNVAYGIGKAACDRMAADTAVELQRYNITSVSLWPGAVKTELVTHNVIEKPADDKASAAAERVRRMFENGESTEFSGLCVRALAVDPQRLTKTGRVLMTGDLAYEYGLQDVDGRVIPSVRMLNGLLAMSGHTWLAAIVPNFVRVPAWMLSAATSKY